MKASTCGSLRSRRYRPISCRRLWPWCVTHSPMRLGCSRDRQQDTLPALVFRRRDRLSAWYREHGGAVLGTTINKYCYLTCRHLPPFFEHRIRVVYRQTETCNTVEEVQHPVVRATLRYLGFQRGLELHHDGDLPARSGMGSSSAFTVGLLQALYAL